MSDSRASGIAIAIDQLHKRYGDFTALSDINLDINDNEFFTLLGPSGCGKTSLLRIIAGFEATSEGRVFLYGEEIENLPPHRRPINTVFQHYSLFPHMSVVDNIGFGLKMLAWSDKAIKARVADMVSLVKLDEFIHRKPSQLSGGQQQRVALARAMAPEPKVLLLDEPLSALDLKLRQQMRSELKTLQRETGITFVFVTHDQEEALSMSDRIAVMSNGKVQQVGSPASIYEMPANRFIADFIGDTNLLDAQVTQVHGGTGTVRLAAGDSLTVDVKQATQAGDHGVISIRPEKLQLAEHTEQLNTDNELLCSGEICDVVYLGTDRQYLVRLADAQTLSVRSQIANNEPATFHTGDAVRVYLAKNAARYLAD